MNGNGNWEPFWTVDVFNNRTLITHISKTKSKKKLWTNFLRSKTANHDNRNQLEQLTNSTKAWLRLAPTLHLVLTILPKGLQSSTSSSSLQSHGKFRRWRTFDGVCVYRNCCCPDVDIGRFRVAIPTVGVLFTYFEQLVLFFTIPRKITFRVRLVGCE